METPKENPRSLLNFGAEESKRLNELLAQKNKPIPENLIVGGKRSAPMIQPVTSPLGVYVAHAINGCGFDEVADYYARVVPLLREYGYNVFHPMVGKGVLRTEEKFKAVGYANVPFVTNKAILRRDRWMIHNSQVVFTNLLGATRVSIGSCMEVAIGLEQDKHIVLVMEENNIHRHAFMIESADVIFTEEEAAIEYLYKLIKGTM